MRRNKKRGETYNGLRIIATFTCALSGTTAAIESSSSNGAFDAAESRTCKGDEDASVSDMVGIEPALTCADGDAKAAEGAGGAKASANALGEPNPLEAECGDPGVRTEGSVSGSRSTF